MTLNTGEKSCLVKKRKLIPIPDGQQLIIIIIIIIIIIEKEIFIMNYIILNIRTIKDIKSKLKKRNHRVREISIYVECVYSNIHLTNAYNRYHPIRKKNN